MKAQVLLEYLMLFAALLSVLALIIPSYNSILNKSIEVKKTQSFQSFDYFFNSFLSYCKKAGFVSKEIIFPKNYSFPDASYEGVFEGKMTVYCVFERGELIVKAN
ncbi:hypothetical protein HUU53_02000 [Candidatus Micrarchaeota archaeon]|nr:hypothetical protein [Candidatus Micrarchaeota archaeon]